MYIVIVDYEKMCDNISQKKLWGVLDEFGVEEYLIMGVKNLYKASMGKRKEAVFLGKERIQTRVSDASMTLQSLL